MKLITFSINAVELTVAGGTTILDAAEKIGIPIPTLCRVADKSEADCGICAVECEGSEELLRACSTQAAAGMVIRTDTETVKKYRQKQLTRLAATHFGDCKAPCNLTCPGQINVQGYIAHVAKGQYEEAVRLIMERNPFPFSVGRVCPRFCETRCRRILVDEPVSINHLKRFVADWCMANKIDLKIRRRSLTGKKVAVVGGGPAGLTAAYFLAEKGHAVTVFEANDKLGGMLRYGLPEYKIPKKILDYEISSILRLGISVQLNQHWGRDFTLASLNEQGFDSVLLTIGTTVDQPLEIPGATLNNVLPATRFLHMVNEEVGRDYGRRAAVIGGNNVAMETARCLLRNNVDQVTIIYPRAQLEMPANQRNIREAEREGVQFLLMASPIQIMEKDGGLELELIRMKLGEADARGIRLPVAIPGSANILKVDTVIYALGQSACGEEGIPGDRQADDLEFTPGNIIKANPRTSLTNLADVYAAGDATSGPRSVIQAVVSARRAAENIHAALMAVSKEPADSRFNFSRGRSFDDVDMRNFDGVKVRLREKMPSRPPERCIQDFDEVKLGFTEQMARREAARCLSCGCTAFDRCDFKRLCIENFVDPNKTGMGTSPRYKKDLSHPVIAVDLDKCVFCRRCVNSCQYGALEMSAASLDNEGRPQEIRLRFNEKCTHCGQCVDSCSTGALNKKDMSVPITGEATREIRTTCPYCGAGCQMLLKVKGNTIMEVESEPDLAPNYGALCVKGRFAFNFIHHPDRLTRPLIRRNGQLVETSWEEALNHAAKRFFDIKAMYGADAIAGFSCARATNEENYLMQKFMRTAIGTNNIDHCARL
ncbi:MAG: (2Fe-2S)-binding protein [Desulfobulbaceae bacterium DB1]|nr:MAG: (2Fe-2S)-binding protein [Desulfobulbaceae bacterium DB1]